MSSIYYCLWRTGLFRIPKSALCSKKGLCATELGNGNSTKEFINKDLCDIDLETVNSWIQNGA
jgi:hypothetical protein